MNRFLVPILVLVAASASAQPTITNITPGYGGAGPHSPATYTISGTGFVTTAKWTRFTNAAGQDLFTTVDCSAGGGTTCTATGVQPFLLSAGTASTIQIYARTNAGVSASGTSFFYYGQPTITSLTPDFGPFDGTTPFVVSGGGYTTSANGFPGTTSIVLGSTTTDLPSGCTTATSCTGVALSLASDPTSPQGAKILQVRTPGGIAQKTWIYGTGTFRTVQSTPSITGVSVSTGPLGGGNPITIRGTGFKGSSQPIPGFGINGGTVFNFITPAGTFPATNVSCPASTRCNMTAPAGVAGPVGIEVYTVCAGFIIDCFVTDRPIISESSGVYRGLYAYAGIKLTPGALGPIVVSESGLQATYQVSLYGPPAANVHVDVSVLPGIATVSPASLNFTPTNWAEPQTVTVTGLDDGGAIGDTSFTVHHVASSADPNYAGAVSDQSGISVDNDSKRYVVWPQYGLVTSRSGGTATFNVVLTFPPTTHTSIPGEDHSQVVVRLDSSDAVAGTAAPTSVTFDSEPGPIGYNVPRTITITGHNDGTPGITRDYPIVVTGGGDVFAAPGTRYDDIVPPDVHVVNIDSAGTPSGLTVTRIGLDRATVIWNLNAASEFYRIKYSTAPGGAKTLVASSAMSGQTITGLTIGQPYYFVISGINAAGESANSAEVPFIMYPPSPVNAFDGDSKAEMVVTSANGDWKILNSIGGYTTSTTVKPGFFNGVAVMGDFDGDQRKDVVIYREGIGQWLIFTSTSGFASAIVLDWGGNGYVPVAGDFDGDGKADPAVYRLSDGQWSALKSSTGYTASIVINWGGAGYTPIPGQDFDGDFLADIAVYHQASGSWYILKSSTNYTTSINKAWGGPGFALVPGDYDGDGKCDLGLYERTTGNWYVLLSGANYTTAINQTWGGREYLPIPGDYDGDGKTDLGVYELATTRWKVLLSSTGYTSMLSVPWGTRADRPLTTALLVVLGAYDTRRATDIDGDGLSDFTVFNPASGIWMTLTSTSNYTSAITSMLGGPGYTVTGDYDGDGRADRAVYHNGDWTIQLAGTNFTTTMRIVRGTISDPGVVPVSGDFDGDGKTDAVRYVADGFTNWSAGLSNGVDSLDIRYGGIGYNQVAEDFDGDGKTDVGVYQPSTGLWSILLSSRKFTTSIVKNVGGPGWVPAPGDYDGDGKADLVVYNTATGQWYGLLSASNYTTTINMSWGGTGYSTVKGDFDGDNRIDLAVYDPSSSTFYVLLSGANYTTAMSKTVGGPGFVAVPQYGLPTLYP